MKITEIKASYLAIDSVFSNNPHQVEILFLSTEQLEFVGKGNNVVILKSATNFSYVVAPETGFFVPCSSESLCLTKKELKNCVLGLLFEDIKDAFSYMIGECQVRIEEDLFTKDLDSVWEWTGIVQSKGRIQLGVLDHSLFISFGFQKNEGIVSFCNNSSVFYNGELLYGYASNTSLSQNDTISLLFEDGSVLDFNLLKRADNPDLLFCPLYKEDIDAFLQKEIIKYRISFAKQNVRPITEDITNVVFGDFTSHALQYYIQKYIEQIKQIAPTFHFPSRTKAVSKESTDFDWCCVYLMQDVSNGFFKIGISNNPEYRERTLQSEKPTIELLASKKFPTRKIAEAIESALHTTYSKQRIRGEWFKLDDVDVAAIIETLK